MTQLSQHAIAYDVFTCRFNCSLYAATTLHTAHSYNASVGAYANCTYAIAIAQMWVHVFQVALAGIATWQFKTGASSWDRLRILPLFFLGSSELASGLVGL